METRRSRGSSAFSRTSYSFEPSTTEDERLFGYEDAPTQKKETKMRRYATLLVLGVVLAAICVALVWSYGDIGSSSGSGSSTESTGSGGSDHGSLSGSENDNTMASDSYAALQAARDSTGGVTLSGTVLHSPQLTTLFVSTLGADGLLLQDSVVTLDTQSTPNQIVISGKAPLASYSSLDVNGVLKYSNGSPMLLLEFAPPADSEFSFQGIYPKENLPKDLTLLPLSGSKVYLSSYDISLTQNKESQETAQGLILAADLHLTSNSSTPSSSNSLIDKLEALAHLAEAEIAKLWGSLKPNFSVTFHLPDVAIGHTVKLTNSIVTLEKRDPVLNLTSTLTITPSGVSPMSFVTQADLALAPLTISLSGDLASPWNFPGASDDARLKLTRLDVDMTVNVGANISLSERLVKGDVSGQFAYGSVSLEMGIQYPAADKVEQIAFELVITDSVEWGALPALPLYTSFPSLVASRTALVLSPMTGSHCFAATNPPTTQCVNVHSGINVYSAVNFTSSTAALALSGEFTTTESVIVLLEGHYEKNTGFNASMSVPGHLVLTPSIDLSALSFSFVDPNTGSVSIWLSGKVLLALPEFSTLEIDISGSSVPPLVTFTSTTTFASTNLTLPLVDVGTAVMTMLAVNVVWNNDKKSQDFKLSGQAVIGNMQFDTTLHKLTDPASAQSICWDTTFDAMDKASISALSQGITGADLFYNTGIAAEVASEVMGVIESEIAGITVSARVFCESAAVGVVLADMGVFGEVFVGANFSSILTASGAISALSQLDTDGNAQITPLTAQVQALTAVSSDLKASFLNPFPSYALCDYLLPIQKIIQIEQKRANLDPEVQGRLQNASIAVAAILAGSGVCSVHLDQDAAALNIVDASKKSGVVINMLPLNSWHQDQALSWTFGGGKTGSLTPPSFPAIETQEALLSLASHDILLDLAFHIHTPDLDVQGAINVTDVVTVGLSFTFSMHPMADASKDPFDGALNWLMPNVNTLVFKGSLSVTKAWSLSAAVTDGEIDAGSWLSMSNTLIMFESVTPFVHLHTHAILAYTDNSGLHPFGVDLDGSFSGVEQFDMSAASSGTWEFDFGASEFNITNLQVSLSLHKQSTGSKSVMYSVNVGGDLSVGNGVLSAKVTSSSSDPLIISATVTDTKPPTLGDAIITVLGLGYKSVPAAQEVRDSFLATIAFAGSSMKFDLGAKTFTFDGRALGFGGEGDFQLQVAPTKTQGSTSAWDFVIGMGWEASMPFSHFAPTVTSLDTLQIGPPALVLSSYDTSVTFNFKEVSPTTPTVTYQVTRGLGMFASLVLNNGNTLVDWIHQWTGIEQVVINIDIESLDQFEVKGELQGHLEILPWTTIMDLGLVLDVKPTEVSAGIESSSVFAPPYGGNVTLYGRVMGGTLGVSARYASLTPWSNVLGVSGLEVERCDLQGELSYALVPLSAGVGGGLKYGAIGGDMGVLVDVTTQDTVFKAELDDFVLYDIIQSCCSSIVDLSGRDTVLLQTGVGLAVMYSNPLPHVVDFNGETYPPGVIVRVQQLLVLGFFNASGEVDITSGGLSVSASLQPFTLTPWLQVGGDSPTGPEDTPAIFSVVLVSGKPSVFKVDGAIRLFGLAFGTIVDFSNAGIVLDVDFESSLFNFHFAFTSVGPLKHPNDFTVAAEINFEVLDYLNATLPEHLKNSTDQYNQKFIDVHNQLEGLRSDLKGLQDQIDARQADDAKVQTDAEKALEDAQIDVAHAKQKVDSLQQNINDLISEIDNLPWYNKWESVPLGVELGALYVAKETADLVLNAANEVLKIAEVAVPVIHDLDPVLDGLIASAAIANASIDAAEATLSGVNRVLDNVLTIETEIVQKLTVLFNPEELKVGGSLSKMKQLDLGYVDVRGWLLGVHVEFAVEVDLKFVEHLGSEIWSWIAHQFGVNGHLAIDQYRVNQTAIQP